MSAASDAADIASRLPIDHRVAQLARMRLDVAVRDERKAMKFTKIYAPDPRATGSTTIGPNTLSFDEGVAEVDLEALTPGALDYMRSQGYGIGKPAEPLPETPHAITLDGSPAPDSRTILSPLNSVGQPIVRSVQ